MPGFTPTGAVTWAIYSSINVTPTHPNQDYDVAVIGGKQVSSFSSKKKQAEKRNQNIGHYRRHLKRGLGTPAIERSLGRGVTERKAARHK